MSDSSIPPPVSNTHQLRQFVIQIVTDSAETSWPRDILPTGPTSIPFIVAVVVQVVDRVYLQGQELRPEIVFSEENIRAVIPETDRRVKSKCLSLVRVAEFTLSHSLGLEATSVERESGHQKPYSPEGFPRIKQWTVA